MFKTYKYGICWIRKSKMKKKLTKGVANYDEWGGKILTKGVVSRRNLVQNAEIISFETISPELKKSQKSSNLPNLDFFANFATKKRPPVNHLRHSQNSLHVVFQNPCVLREEKNQHSEKLWKILQISDVDVDADINPPAVTQKSNFGCLKARCGR